MTNILEVLATTSLDHDERNAIASCVVSCCPLPEHLRKRLEAHDSTDVARPVSELVDTLAIGAFAPRIAGRLAALPNGQREAARVILFAQLEALK